MKNSKLRLLIKILAVIIICLISFVGIYVQKLNTMENVVKDYNLSKDLEGYRQIILEASDETDDDTGEAVNSDEDKTTENYELAKSILEERLSSLNKLSGYEELKDINVEDYNISLDKQTGKIYLQIPETNSTDYVVSNITESATIELKDSEDGTVYLNSDNLKSAQVVYSTTDSGTIVYLELEFDKEGTEILADISSNDYATIEESDEEETSDIDESIETEESEENTSGEDTETEENEESEETTETDESEDEETEEEATQKEVTLTISGSDVVTTSFDDPITEGVMDLSMNSATSDEEELESYFESAATIAILLNSGALPLTYTVTENQYVNSDISIDTIKTVLIVVAIVFIILLVYMIIRKKSKGLLAAISFIGFTALYLLLIRYTNAVISLESIIGGILVLFMDYMFSYRLLNINRENKKIYNKEYLQNVIKLIPVFAISIVFTFTSWTVINSLGIILFWGILLIVLYNILVTKYIVD